MCEQTEYGFDCVCDHVEKNPGTKEFSCEFCGLYQAGKARCTECEESIDMDDTSLF